MRYFIAAMGERFALVLFSTDVPFVQGAVAAGVDSVMIDWERRGKVARQTGADTEINADTPLDLASARSTTRSSAARARWRAIIANSCGAFAHGRCAIARSEVRMPSLEGATVLVTRAAGFIGANLCRSLLAKGARAGAPRERHRAALRIPSRGGTAPAARSGNAAGRPAKDADGELINVGAGRHWSNEEIVTTVGAATGRALAVRSGAFPRRASDTAYWIADIRKAERLLGWRPRHDLDAGIAATLAWRRGRSAPPAA